MRYGRPGADRLAARFPRDTQPMSKLQHAPVISLCPTQLTVGLHRGRGQEKEIAELVAQGPGGLSRRPPHAGRSRPCGGTCTSQDHHHLARAAYDLKIKEACFEVDDDLSALTQDIFWIHMEKESWVHPLDRATASGIATRSSRRRSTSWSTTSIARWPASCATRAATTRRTRRSPNSSGRITSGATSRVEDVLENFARRREAGHATRARSDGEAHPRV